MTGPHFATLRAPEPGPVVVEIPHAGLVIDAAAERFTRIPRPALEAGAILCDSDVGADRVWEGSDAADVTRIVAHASRYVIDLNTAPRLPTPYEEKMPAALRAVLHRSQCGQSWRKAPLPRAELERRIHEVFEPYHEEIERELARARDLHGAAVLISSHTFHEQQAPGVDVVVGTLRGASAGAPLRAAVDEVARRHGLSVALEEPFAGGYAAARHGRPADGVSVVQIELSRRLVCVAEESPPRVDAERARRVARMLADVVQALRRRIGSTVR